MYLSTIKPLRSYFNISLKCDTLNQLDGIVLTTTCFPRGYCYLSDGPRIFSSVSSCLAPYTAFYMAWVGRNNSCKSFCGLKILVMPCGRLLNMCICRAICYLQFNREHHLAKMITFCTETCSYRFYWLFWGFRNIYFFSPWRNNSFTTPFFAGSCLATYFLRICIKIKYPTVTTCSIHIYVVPGQVFNKFSSIRKKRKSVLLVFCVSMLKDKCI